MKKLLIILSIFLSYTLSAQTTGGIKVVGGVAVFTPDTSTQKFINAVQGDGTTLTATQKFSVSYLTWRQKIDGTWSIMVAEYPFVGGTESAHKYNLKDPRNLDAAYRIVWYGTVTHNSLGIKSNGTTGYGNTNIIPSTALTINNTHLSAYITSNDPSATSNTMRVSVSMTEFGLITKRSNGTTGSLQPTSITAIPSNANSVYSGDARGFYLGTNNGTSHLFLKDGVDIITSSSQNNWGLPPNPLYILARNSNGALETTSIEYKSVGFLSVGAGLTLDKSIKFYNNVKFFNSILGR